MAACNLLLFSVLISAAVMVWVYPGIIRADAKSLAGQLRSIRETSTKIEDTNGKKATSTQSPPQSMSVSSNATCSINGTDEKGMCVLYYLCDNKHEEKNKNSNININSGSEDPCESYIEICCPVRGVVSQIN
ncbi:hypothetical protein ACJJTC_002666 [Scirpophaga incertulas]